MNDSQIREMVLALIFRFDYDLWKELSEAENPRHHDNQEIKHEFLELQSIVKQHLRKVGL
jgi:hypothetical protein